VFSIHGGLSPDLDFVSDAMRIGLRQEIPAAGLLADLTWSDPEEPPHLEWHANPRGAGFVFGRSRWRDSAGSAACG
jgi:serine/threonine-protein phosphatase 4 catalytic subunit